MAVQDFLEPIINYKKNAQKFGYNKAFHMRAEAIKEITKDQHCQLCDRWTDGVCFHD